MLQMNAISQLIHVVNPAALSQYTLYTTSLVVEKHVFILKKDSMACFSAQ